MAKKWKHYMFSLAVWLALWIIIDILMPADTNFAGPVQVVLRFVKEVQRPEFWIAIWTTYSGIIAGFIVAVVTGTILGYLAYYFDKVEKLMTPLLGFFRYIPMISFTLLAILAGTSTLLVFEVSVFLSLPVIYRHTYIALKHHGAEDDYLQRVWQHDVHFLKKIDHIYRPATMPEYMIGCHRSINMCCKSGILAQFLGKASHSVAKSLSVATTNMDVEGIFMWTLVIVAISIGLERLMIHILSLSIINETRIDVDKLIEIIDEDEDIII